MKSTAVRLLSCALLSPLAWGVECAREPVVAQSRGTHTAIAELYTSEGCESCPPADKWFSGLSSRKGATIPLAFHVDYWDSGGWKDRFANPAYSARQRELVTRAGSRTVVTPQLFVNGSPIPFVSPADRRGLIYSRFAARVSEAISHPPKASLTLESAFIGDGLNARLTVMPVEAARADDLAAWLVLTESNLSSRVSAGENSGVTLHHDHVVRKLSGPIPLSFHNHTSDAVVTRALPLERDWKLQDLVLVAFVQNSRNMEVQQAVAIPVCKQQ